MLWWRNARVLSLTGAVGALLMLGACSAPPSEDVTPSAIAGTASTASAGQPSDSNAGQPGAAAGKNDGGSLAWVPPGPADPGDPPPSQWYDLLLNKDCAGLVQALGTEEDNGLDGYALWSAAAAVCRAVYQGDDTGWTDAAAGLPALARPASGDCLNLAAYDFVASFVAFHAQNPAVLPSPGAGSGTACPLGFAGLLAIDATETPTNAPSSGLAGGRFQLVGRFLDVAAVLVDGQPVGAEPDPSQPGRWVVVIPPAAAAGQVQVSVSGSAGPVPGSVTFTYLDDAAAPVVPEVPVESAVPSDAPAITTDAPISTPEPAAGGG